MLASRTLGGAAALAAPIPSAAARLGVPMRKYAAMSVLVRLALWASPLQGYFGSSMQCATPFTSASRRECNCRKTSPQFCSVRAGSHVVMCVCVRSR